MQQELRTSLKKRARQKSLQERMWPTSLHVTFGAGGKSHCRHLAFPVNPAPRNERDDKPIFERPHADMLPPTLHVSSRISFMTDHVCISDLVIQDYQISGVYLVLARTDHCMSPNSSGERQKTTNLQNKSKSVCPHQDKMHKMERMQSPNTSISSEQSDWIRDRRRDPGRHHPPQSDHPTNPHDPTEANLGPTPGSTTNPHSKVLNTATPSLTGAQLPPAANGANNGNGHTSTPGDKSNTKFRSSHVSWLLVSHAGIRMVYHD